MTCDWERNADFVIEHRHLGVVGMLFAPSSSYVIFFKMIFIVVVLGVIHSLILVPILLQLLLDIKSYLRQGVAIHITVKQ